MPTPHEPGREEGGRRAMRISSRSSPKCDVPIRPNDFCVRGLLRRTCVAVHSEGEVELGLGADELQVLETWLESALAW